MGTFDKVNENLLQKGYKTAIFSTAAEAVDYLDSQVDGRKVAFGGSCTLDTMGLYERLSSHNTVTWHWRGDSVKDAANSEIYFSSANGMAETGEMINIDGNGNRVSRIAFGPKKVYIVVGKNKLVPTYDEALWRARNIAAPKNAIRLNKKTPCAVNGDKCFDCQSPDRICRVLSVMWGPSKRVDEVEVVMIDEDLGY